MEWDAWHEVYEAREWLGKTVTYLLRDMGKRIQKTGSSQRDRDVTKALKADALDAVERMRRALEAVDPADAAMAAGPRGRRANPYKTCPRCRAGVKEAASECWKCGLIFDTGAGGATFGRVARGTFGAARNRGRRRNSDWRKITTGFDVEKNLAELRNEAYRWGESYDRIALAAETANMDYDFMSVLDHLATLASTLRRDGKSFESSQVSELKDMLYAHWSDTGAFS